MLHWPRKIIRVTITALFICVSAVMVALLLPAGWRVMSVQTGSMKPNLSPGDLILVRRLPAQEYKTGDVVTFINPGDRSQTVTHRIVESADGPKRRVFTTKGDANEAADRPISENLIVGKQVGSLPYLGHVIDFSRTIPGLLLIIWLPALGVIAGEMGHLAAYYRRLKPYSAPGRTPRQPAPL